MPSLTILTHTTLFYLKFYKLMVYAVQFTGVWIFLSWSNCLISSTFMQVGWMPTDITLGSSRLLVIQTFTLLLTLICGTLAWKLSNNLHFELDDVVITNMRSTDTDSRGHLLNPDRNSLWSRKCVIISFCTMSKVQVDIRNLLTFAKKNYQAFFSRSQLWKIQPLLMLLFLSCIHSCQ